MKWGLWVIHCVPGRGRRLLLVSGVRVTHARPLTHLQAPRRRRHAAPGGWRPRYAKVGESTDKFAICTDIVMRRPVNEVRWTVNTLISNRCWTAKTRSHIFYKKEHMFVSKNIDLTKCDFVILWYPRKAYSKASNPIIATINSLLILINIIDTKSYIIKSGTILWVVHDMKC